MASVADVGQQRYEISNFMSMIIFSSTVPVVGHRTCPEGSRSVNQVSKLVMVVSQQCFEVHYNIRALWDATDCEYTIPACRLCEFQEIVTLGSKSSKLR